MYFGSEFAKMFVTGKFYNNVSNDWVTLTNVKIYLIIEVYTMCVH